jgi:hypothetical protein
MLGTTELSELSEDSLLELELFDDKLLGLTEDGELGLTDDGLLGLADD